MVLSVQIGSTNRVRKDLNPRDALDSVSEISAFYSPAQAQVDQRVERGFERFRSGDYRGAILIFDQDHEVVRSLHPWQLTQKRSHLLIQWIVQQIALSVSFIPMLSIFVK